MFTTAQVDEESDIYKLLHPSKKRKSAPDLVLEERFANLPESDSDPEGQVHAWHRHLSRLTGMQASSDEESSEEEQEIVKKAPPKKVML